eukprot:CAMPEP_0197842328 /NCGR_PEP_ID=MMETSP1437-20131217/46676_1 /TAXON_ID=49252 ORGANISM="Eucampia antarctica, Strain CCMP1452" /NCGR_SAMPLE_ID=MMETSP1437 /ASSEMBLY_ACC=CAM_ASM_001096 /LENGTH=113 /DNA_ID=CAMNT_0043452189 /DNA_START=1107 /DNA_END=1448 /DNA_ORIENTATION=-
MFSSKTEFIRSDDTDEESLRGLQFYIDPGNEIANDESVEVIYNQNVMAPTQTVSDELDAIIGRLSSSFDDEYFPPEGTMSSSEKNREQQRCQLNSLSFGSNRDMGPTEDTVIL